MIRRVILAAGGLAWGAVTAVLGVYATFPGDAARDWAIFQFDQRWGRDYALDLGEVAPWSLPGLGARDVALYTVQKKSRRAKKGEDLPPPVREPLLAADHVGVRLEVLPALLGRMAFGFGAELYGGDVDGRFARSDTVTELAFETEGMDLARMPVDTDAAKLALRGTLSGDADLRFDSADVKNSSGTLRLSFDGLALGEGSTVAGFTLPVVTFTKAQVAFEAKDGKLEVTEGAFESDVIDATLSGDILLNKKLERSRYRLELVFTLPEDIDKLAQIAPDMKRARDDEGRYHFNVGGTLSSPHFRASRASAVRSPIQDRGGPSLAGTPTLSGGDADPDESAEDRRKRREERIKERRERMRKRREEAAQQRGDAGAEEEVQAEEPLDDEGEFDGEEDLDEDALGEEDLDEEPAPPERAADRPYAADPDLPPPRAPARPPHLAPDELEPFNPDIVPLEQPME